jgi:hypothetical protein
MIPITHHETEQQNKREQSNYYQSINSEIEEFLAGFKDEKYDYYNFSQYKTEKGFKENLVICSITR